MKLEDFTIYDETDSGNDITVIPNKMDVSSMRYDAVSYVVKDYGANHFADFVHLLDIYASPFGANGFGGMWALVSIAGRTYKSMVLASDGLAVYVTGSLGTYEIRLIDCGSDSDSCIISVSTPYYLTIERSGTALTCEVYSDRGRTTLVDTISVVCETTKYRYLQGVFSNGAVGAQEGTYYIENLDLQEGLNPLIGKHLISPDIIKKPIIR